jgi:hypothetical protein
VFQGSLRKRHYFEGWYFKHVSPDLENAYAFIAGISLAPGDSHSFIQILNGITGETHYAQYGVDDFTWERDRLLVRVGDSLFTDKFIELAIDSPGVNAAGRVEYLDPVRYPKSLLAPGIMGWYQYVPFMECYHGIVSADHSLRGTVTVNGATIDFGGGRGYIEKDWGRSFPDGYLWLQCNTFEADGVSLFLSVARIPWLGRFFVGLISFLYCDGGFHLFSTYNRSKIAETRHGGGSLAVTLENAQSRLEAEASMSRSGELKAPSSGEMSRRIKESIDSEVRARLTSSRDGKVIFEGFGRRAGLEVIEKIFDYV